MKRFLAEKALSCLVLDDIYTDYILKEDSPKWVKDLAIEAHRNAAYPDGYRYNIISESLKAISNGHLNSSCIKKELDNEDYKDLLDWFYYDVPTDFYINKAIKEKNGPFTEGIYGILIEGKKKEYEMVFNSIFSFLEDLEEKVKKEIKKIMGSNDSNLFNEIISDVTKSASDQIKNVTRETLANLCNNATSDQIVNNVAKCILNESCKAIILEVLQDKC